MIQKDLLSQGKIKSTHIFFSFSFIFYFFDITKFNLNLFPPLLSWKCCLPFLHVFKWLFIPGSHENLPQCEGSDIRPKKFCWGEQGKRQLWVPSVKLSGIAGQTRKQLFQVRLQLNSYTFLLTWPTYFLTHIKHV